MSNPTKTTQAPTRIIFLDYLRCVACFLVLMVHSSESQYGTGDIPLLSESHALWMAIWDGISRISVPLFIITSAYLLAPMKDGQPWGEFYRRRFLRILPPMFIFMAIYALAPALTSEQTLGEAMKVLCTIPLNFPENAFHLWFMYPLIGLYLLIPILSPWLRTATERQERMFLILWAITTCLPFVNKFYGEVFGQCWWNQYHMLYDFSGYPGYLVLGHYLRTHILADGSPAQTRLKTFFAPTKTRLSVGLAMLLSGWTFTILSFYLQAQPGIPQLLGDLEIAWCFCIINCVVATIGAFLIFSTITRRSAIVESISRHSFGMYLMHLLWMNLLVAPLLNPLLPVGVAIPIVAIATYILCYISTFLLSKLPASRWFIGS